MSLMPGPTIPDSVAGNTAVSSVQSVYSEANDSPRLEHSGLRNSSSVTYFRQPPNLPTAADRNRKCTECGTTAFGRNQMSTKSAHLSTFGAETEAKAKIRSTSTVDASINNQSHTCTSASSRTDSLPTSSFQFNGCKLHRPGRYMVAASKVALDLYKLSASCLDNH